MQWKCISKILHNMVCFKVPDNLVDEVVRVLSGKHSESGPCRHTLFKAYHLGVDGEDRRLVHILNRNGDSRCGLKRGLDAASQVGLVGNHHSQHEGTIHLKIHRLEKKRGGGREETEREGREVSVADCKISSN